MLKNHPVLGLGILLVSRALKLSLAMESILSGQIAVVISASISHQVVHLDVIWMMPKLVSVVHS